MEINFRLLLTMLRFLWSNAPRPAKYVLLLLALVAGLSRDWVMIIVNKAAAAPLDVTVNYWLRLFVTAFILVLASAFVYHILSTKVTTSIINELRLKMIGNLLKSQPTFVERMDYGTIYHILTTDVGSVANFAVTLLNLLPALIFLLIAIPQLFYYSFIAGCFAVLVMAGGTLTYYLQQKALTALNTDARLMDVAYFEQVAEMLRGFRELRLNMAKRESFMKGLSTLLNKLRDLLIAVKKIFEIGEASTNSLKYLLFGGLVFLVPYLVKTEATVTLQLLTLVLFSLLPFEQIVSSYTSVIITLVAYVRIQDLNKRLEKYEHINETVEKAKSSFKCIELVKAVARHDSREKSDFILGPINFRLKANKVIFLIGSNGSGKSTFMNILAGLFDLESGQIRVDGKTLQPDDMAMYRSRVSAIFSHFHVFRELHGLEHIGNDAAAGAIERVGLTGITSLSEGKVSRIDLSAGQKRRLALALVLLEDRDILILDEFVADQDPQQREIFFQTLLPWLKAQGKTIIVSTHDLQWLNCADEVYRFDGGKMKNVTQSLRTTDALETA